MRWVGRPVAGAVRELHSRGFWVGGQGSGSSAVLTRGNDEEFLIFGRILSGSSGCKTLAANKHVETRNSGRMRPTHVYV